MKFGSVEAIREAHRDRQGLPVVDSLVRDVRDAWRYWRRNPTLALVVALLSLALGIGANTAIFSIINGLILRELPVRDPVALVHVLREPGRSSFSNSLWEAIRDEPRPFESAAAWYTTSFNLAESGETRYVRGIMTSGGFFDLFGVHPAAGRLLTPADDRRARGGIPFESAAVAVISHGFWQRQFGGAADVVGTPLRTRACRSTSLGSPRPISAPRSAARSTLRFRWPPSRWSTKAAGSISPRRAGCRSSRD